MPFLGKELGKKILEDQNITNVSINSIKQLDHYNPIDKKFIFQKIKLIKKHYKYISR